MEVDEICRLPIRNIAAPDSVLVIWVYGPRHDQVFRVAGAWGYTFKSEAFVWVKTTRGGEPAIGKGFYSRKAAEHALLFPRGRGLPVRDRGVNQVLLTRRREHSRKPDQVYEAL